MLKINVLLCIHNKAQNIVNYVLPIFHVNVK